MLTFKELCEKLLVRYDAEDLIDLLEISSTELLDRFEDKIELHILKIEGAIDELE